MNVVVCILLWLEDIEDELLLVLWDVVLFVCVMDGVVSGDF